MTTPEGHTSLVKESAKLLLYALLCAFMYNGFSPKGLPLIPREVKKESVADSALFGGGSSAPKNEGAPHTPDSVEALPPDSAAKAVQPAKHNETFRIISLDQFKRLRAQKRGILFDARTAADYSVSRIPGALNIPGQEVTDHFGEVAELPRDTLVIIYCNNPDCHLGRMLAEFLTAIAFTDILLYDDGWDGWLAAKEPIDTMRIKK
jgi:rhodanese-related sulfurtransferase